MSYFIYQSKKIYYSEQGSGKPVVFLHGDTASSKMFELLLPLYTDNFKVILIDFLGNGKSDRVEEFPVDLWQEQARQTIALLEHLQYGKVNLVGTSGGAWVAIDAALERPDLVEQVVADSFDGRTLAEDFADNLVKERSAAKKDSRQQGSTNGVREKTGKRLWIRIQMLFFGVLRKKDRYFANRWNS